MPAHSPDFELHTVLQALRALDPDGTRTAIILRDTLDQLYDGQRTGRYRWDQLYKTEKTHCGTLLEINLQRQFKFESGRGKLDYRICGIDVDCKYSQSNRGWMIPPEARGHLCLVVSADDSASKWCMGLIRATNDHLSKGKNRDGKSALNSNGREAVHWLFWDEPLPSNVLLHLGSSVVDGIMAQSSGQKRVNALFRAALGKVVGRGVVATVAQEVDYMKRIRGNGGARTELQPEGIVILGQFHSHVRVAKALGVAVPGPGESVAVCLTPAANPGVGVVEIDGKLWRVGKAGDPVVEAPLLPKCSRKDKV